MFICVCAAGVVVRYPAVLIAHKSEQAMAAVVSSLKAFHAENESDHWKVGANASLHAAHTLHFCPANSQALHSIPCGFKLIKHSINDQDGLFTR